MKIVIVMPAVSRSNGGAASLLDIAEAVSYLGHDVVVVAANDNPSTVVWRRRYSLIPKGVSYCFCLRPLSKPAYPAAKFSALRYLVHTFDRFVVHALHPLAKSQAANGDVYIIGSALSDADFAYLRSIGKRRARFILNHAGAVDTYIDHWFNTNNVLKSYGGGRTGYIKYLEKFDQVMFQSEAQAKELCDLAPRFNNKKIITVRPSTDENKIKAVLNSLPKCAEQDKKSFSIVCIGSIQPRKNQMAALDAFEKFLESGVRAELHFLGGFFDKDYAMCLINSIASRNLNAKVYVHGHVDDHLSWLGQADLLLKLLGSDPFSRQSPDSTKYWPRTVRLIPFTP